MANTTRRTDCYHAAAITPDDVANLDALSFVYVGGDGNMAVVTKEGDTVTFTAVVAGTILPLLVKRVNDTDTTATNLVAMW